MSIAVAIVLHGSRPDADFAVLEGQKKPASSVNATSAVNRRHDPEDRDNPGDRGSLRRGVVRNIIRTSFRRVSDTQTW
jgi:hypothetical protein